MQRGGLASVHAHSHLRTLGGRIGYRCAGEPVDAYVAKGGNVNDTVVRRCLCNAPMANAGLPPVRGNRETEEPSLTSGDDLKTIAAFLDGRRHYAANNVIDYLLAAILRTATIADSGSDGARRRPANSPPD
jgi:hypothetical protein